MFRVGDSVEYAGEIWYVVNGPVMTTDGPGYRISKCPPERMAKERELKKVDG